MKTKILLPGFIVLVLVATLGWSASRALASPTCDSNYVTQAGKVFTVTPNGIDDTANIQCAFDAAVTAGAGSEVRLSAGTFHTAQIVVNDFHGKFTGAGMYKTMVVNLPNLYVAPVDFYLDPPSSDNPWPSLFAFVNGDFAVSDLAIHISGDNGTTGWTIFGIDPPITELAHGVVILGTETNTRVEWVRVEGEAAENALFGLNLINGIFYEGFTGEVSPPISGTFEVYDSIFQGVASGTPVTNLSNAKVVISHNKFENVVFGMDGGDFASSSLEFSYNSVNAVIGFDLYNAFTAEDVASSFLIKNNVFRGGVVGPAFEQTFGAGISCLIIGNNVVNVRDGIYLGPGTTGCTVVGGNTKTNVIDAGVNNILVGVNNMGMGVGPVIQPFMKFKK